MKTLRVNKTELDPKANTPVLDHCRKLISEGEDSTTVLEVYKTKDDDTWDLRINRIGKGARLTVKENPVVKFAKYRTFQKW